MIEGIAARTAAEAARDAPLGDEARALLAGDPDPRRYLDGLLEAGLFADAVRFLAHALPRREAVWWASQCARQAYGASPPAPIAGAIAAAERWAAAHDEESRRECEAAAEVAGTSNPAGCAAMAAFWSGGSLGPPDLQEIPPPGRLTPDGVSAAVLLAVVLTEPRKAAEKFRRFVALGIDVASGKNRWASAPPKGGPSPVAAPSPPPAPQTVTKTTRRVDTWE